MSTNYPGGLDSYTTKQDGVDTVSAAHINNLQDAVTAIETELGTDPKGGYSNVGAAIADKLSASGGTLTGNLACNAGVTVDGVDISTHQHTGTGDGGTAIQEIVDAREDEDNLLENIAMKADDNVCNSVNFSSVDANGLPDYLSAGTGLAVNITASEEDEIGMDIGGYSQYILSNTTISSLTASSTCYLYAGKASSGFTPTLGHTTIAPIYAYTAPGSPATGQHWYDIARGAMLLYDGADWEETDRIFIGECVTDGSSVTSVTAYALKGRYDSGWFAVSANTKYTKNHNLGCLPLNIELLGATDSSDANCHKAGYYDNGTNTYGGMVWNITTTAFDINDNTSGFDYPIRYGASTSAATGYYRVIANRGW